MFLCLFFMEVISAGLLWSNPTRENPTDNQLTARELTPALMLPLQSKALNQWRKIKGYSGIISLL